MKLNNPPELEVLCNNCFTMIKASESAQHGLICCKQESFADPIVLLDMKLGKLRLALEGRLQDSESKLPLMRHLTQLRYHIDTALKWTHASTEVGCLSEHTVTQVKQLTATARVLAPGVYVFSRRIESLVAQKDRELRQLQQAQASPTPSMMGGGASKGLVTSDYRAHSNLEDSVLEVKSVVSDMNSDCGTMRTVETTVTSIPPTPRSGQATDVANMQDCNEYLAFRGEEEQRRWFYSQCLTWKLSCPDRAFARKILISDLWARVKQENVPIGSWIQWIKQELKIPDDKNVTMSAA
jgi:hypothetical protein